MADLQGQAPDLIMFVGHQFYPTADDYIREALSLGCCKRVPTLPGDIVPGRSRCFLAHDDGAKGHSFIFGFFTIAGVEAILDDPDKIAKYEAEYKALNVRIVPSLVAVQEPRRLCGIRPVGAQYVVSGKDENAAIAAGHELADKLDIQGPLAIILRRIPYPRRRFRGWRYAEPQFLEQYGWPQKSLPVKRTVKIEHPRARATPLLEGLDGEKQRATSRSAT